MDDGSKLDLLIHRVLWVYFMNIQYMLVPRFFHTSLCYLADAIASFVQEISGTAN